MWIISSPSVSASFLAPSNSVSKSVICSGLKYIHPVFLDYCWYKYSITCIFYLQCILEPDHIDGHVLVDALHGVIHSTG